MQFWNFPVLLVLIVLQNVCSGKSFPSLEKISNAETERNGYLVKLALFGDVNFGKRFNYDSTKILQYWKVLLYDVHSRFETMPSVSMSFQVTSIHTFKTPEEQPFFENFENENNTSSVSKLAENFQNWVESINQLPNYDMAVLMLGTQMDDHMNDGFVSKGNLNCGEQSNELQPRAPVAIVSLENYTAKQLALGVAQILGESCGLTLNAACTNATSQCCIFESSTINQTSYSRYFSKCLNSMLAEKFSSFTPALDIKHTSSPPIIDSAELYQSSSELFSYTMENYCQIMLNEPAAKSFFGNCEKIICVTNSVSFGRDEFVPLEGTKCGLPDNNERCVRGNCVKPKAYLASVATGKCLAAEDNQILSHNKPVLQNCSKISTDLMVSMEIDEDRMGVPKVLYSSIDGPQTKYLTLDNDSTLRFSRNKDACADSEWMVEWLANTDNKEFLLRHVYTGTCVKTSKDGTNIEITSYCLGNDVNARWKLVRLVETVKSADTLAHRKSFFGNFGPLVFSSWWH